MQEVESAKSNSDLEVYKKMPIGDVLLALESIAMKYGEDAVNTVINRRKKELGENPKLVADLFNKPLDDIVEALSGDMSKVDAKTLIHLKPEFGKKPNVKVITELSRLIESLKTMSSIDAEKIIRRREKDFGRNPVVLSSLLKEAEKSPALKTAIHRSNIVETKYLDVALAKKLLTADSRPILRELRNQAIHKYNATIPKGSMYHVNPKGYSSSDPIEKLVNFMINNSESAFSFLRKPDVQANLSGKPVLVARMLLKGDANLAETMEKERVFEHLPPAAQETLQHIQEIKKGVNTPPLHDTTVGRALKNKLNSLIETLVERDGKNIIEPKTELSLADAAAIRQEVKQMQALYNQMNEIKTTLNAAPLKGSTHAEEFHAQLKTLEQAVLRGNSSVEELNKILPLVQKLQKDVTEKTQETDKVEYIGPPIQALLQEAKKEQQREKRAESSSRAVQKKWPQPEKTIKASHVTKDVELQKATAELKKSEPVTPPLSPPTSHKSPGKH